MARDYSGRRGTKGKKPRKSAGRSRARRQGLPGWVQMFVGLTIGLLIATAVFIYYKPLDTNLIGDGPARGTEPSEPATDADGLPPEEESRFAFYEMLPNYELVIQYEDDDQPVTKKPTAEKPNKEKPSEEKPKIKTVETPKEVAEPGRYIIQAGSFKSFDDADKRKAKLALIGVESTIERVTIDNTKTWYRVRVGPEKDINRVNDLLKRLRDNGVETLLMRHRG